MVIAARHNTGTSDTKTNSAFLPTHVFGSNDKRFHKAGVVKIAQKKKKKKFLF